MDTHPPEAPGILRFTGMATRLLCGWADHAL